MEYVNLGNSGVKVSRLALGMVFRNQRDEREAQRVVETAIDRGINYVDCANTYGPTDDRTVTGRSESILSRVLKGRREDLVITSKVSENVGEGPNDAGLSRDHIIREAERSLGRLGTDHIDIYLAHHYDDSTPLEETLSAFDSLRRAGKIRYCGVSNFAAWQVCKALWVADRHGYAAPICVQDSYSLLNRSLEAETFGLLRAEGLGLMAYSPMGVGLLSGAYAPGKPAPPGTLWAAGRFGDRFDSALAGARGRVVSAVLDAAREAGKTPAQIALAWVLSRPEVSTAIAGCDNVEQLDDNLGSIGWRPDADLLERLDDASSALQIAS